MPSTKKKILIVEDEPTLLDVLAGKFAQEGFEVFTAKNGEEGLVQAVQKLPDLILLDIIMPFMDGISMLKELRQHEQGKDIPVIMLTNLSDSNMVLESLQNKAFDYLVKTDWEIPEVVAKVKARLHLS